MGDWSPLYVFLLRFFLCFGLDLNYKLSFIGKNHNLRFLSLLDSGSPYSSHHQYFSDLKSSQLHIFEFLYHSAAAAGLLIGIVTGIVVHIYFAILSADRDHSRSCPGYSDFHPEHIFFLLVMVGGWLNLLYSWSFGAWFHNFYLFFSHPFYSHMPHSATHFSLILPPLAIIDDEFLLYG